MNKKFRIGLIAAGILAIAGLAYAQVTTLPQVSKLSPTVDLIQVIPNGQPNAGNKYAPITMATNTVGYYKAPVANVAGFTYTFGTNVTFAMFNPAGTIATGSITLAANPSDGSRNCFFTLNIITTLTLSANTGQTLNNAATATTANGTQCYVYSASNSTWDRS